MTPQAADVRAERHDATIYKRPARNCKLARVCLLVFYGRADSVKHTLPVFVRKK